MKKIEPVMAFFDGPQVGIFRRISKKTENFRRNAQFLSDEARSNVDCAPDSANLRKECERIHGHIKNTVKFNVRRVMEESKELYAVFKVSWISGIDPLTY